MDVMLNAMVQELLSDIATSAVEAANVERIATSVAQTPRDVGSRECDICMNSAFEVYALVPCGHLLCKQCAGRFSKCPTCSKPVASTLRVFM